MSVTLATVFTTAAGAADHAGLRPVEMPMSAVAFGVTALVIWVVLLLVTFAFRSYGTRHD